jgi:hypothetical protein
LLGYSLLLTSGKGKKIQKGTEEVPAPEKPRNYLHLIRKGVQQNKFGDKEESEVKMRQEKATQP